MTLITIACLMCMYGAFMTGMWLGAKASCDEVIADRDFWKQMYRNERAHVVEMLKLDKR